MYHLEHCYFRGVRPELTSIVKMAMVRWKTFLVPTSGSDKFSWSHESALSVMNRLREEGLIQYAVLKDENGWGTKNIKGGNVRCMAMT